MTHFDQRSQRVETQYNAGRDITIVAPLSLTDAQQRRNRSAMLAKVRSRWITGVLEQSLHGAALIELGLHQQSDAVANPWHLVLQESDQSARPLPAKTSITQVYDDAGSELLILGEPGSGKTTLLLELTRDLLTRATRDETHPMPVVFNLSSWALKRQPLANWLIEELNSKYQVPRKLGQVWVATDQMILLLDGLDEVAEEHRAACVEAINAYRREHGLVSIVICSRRAEYLAQTRRVQLRSAVLVQPLTAEQIEEYLSSAGERLGAVRVVLRNDQVLQELTTSPLMLSVLTLAYAEKSVKDLQMRGVRTTRRQVFADYVERMLHRRGGNAHYSPQQTIHWLIWLAQQVLSHRQTEFYIERMQLDWLAKGQLRTAYERLAGNFIDVVIGILIGILVNTLFSSGSFSPEPSIFFNLAYGLLGGLIGGFISEGERRSAEKGGWSWRNIAQTLTDIRHLRTGLLLGMIVWLIGAVLTWLGIADPPRSSMPQLLAWIHDGLSVGLVGLLLSMLFWGGKAINLLGEEANWSWRNIGRSLLKTRHVKIGLMAFLSVGLVFGLREGIGRIPFDPVLYGLSEGVAHGLRAGLIAILLSFLLRGKRTVIQPAEIIIWSWKGIVRSLIRAEHLRNSLIVGSSIVLSAGLGYGLYLLPVNAGLNYVLGLGLRSGLGFGLAVGLSYWLFIGLLSGLSSNMLEERDRVKPNEGIWRSARNSIIIGLLGGGVFWSVFVLNYVLISGVLGQALAYWAEGGYNTLDLSPFWSVLLSFAKSTVQCSWESVGNISYETLGCYVWSQGFTYGLIAGLVSGLLAWLLNGGRACIQHMILRVLLWHTKVIPWNYPHFLDEAADRILLRKVGGGYIFVHRLLLDYFATQEALPVFDEPTENRAGAIRPSGASRTPAGPTAPDVLPEPPSALLPLPPTPILPESPRLLPCRHEQRPNARFCSVCGAPVPSPDQSEGDVADIPFFPNPRAEKERARQAEQERRRQAEEKERARQAEEERLRQVEEERHRQAEEERARQAKEQADKIEEERVRRAKEMVLAPTEMTTPSLQTLLPTEAARVSMPPVSRSDAMVAVKLAKPGAMRRFVLLGLAGLVILALASGIVWFTAHPVQKQKQDLYSQITSKAPTLNDPLSDNSQGNWDVRPGQCSFTNGAYHVYTFPQGGSAVFCFLRNPIVGRIYAFQIQMTIIKGDATGINGGFFFEGKNNHSYNQAFFIGLTGNYAFGGISPLILPRTTTSHTSAFHGGLNQTNQITLIVSESEIDLYINGQYIASTAHDFSDSNNFLALIANSDTSNSVEVTYSNAKLWNL